MLNRIYLCCSLLILLVVEQTLSAAEATADGCSWSFSGQSDTGWKVSGATKAQGASEGLVLLSGKDIQLNLKGQSIDADRLSSFSIRMKSDKNTTGQIFFAQAGKVFTEKQSFRFMVKAGECNTYHIACAANSEWKGKIASLRIDPASAPGVNVEIFSIRLGEPEYAWTFSNSADMAGWQTNQDVKDRSVTDEGIVFISGKDCMLTKAGLSVPAQSIKSIRIEMKADHDSSGQLFFVTPATRNFDNKYSFRFNVRKSAALQTYTIDCTSNPLWADRILNLRIDPVSTEGVHVAVKALTLVR